MVAGIYHDYKFDWLTHYTSEWDQLFLYYFRAAKNQSLIVQLEEERGIVKYNLARLKQMITKVS